MEVTRAEVEAMMANAPMVDINDGEVEYFYRASEVRQLIDSWLARDAEREKIVAELNALLEAIEADVGFRFDKAWAHRKLQDAVTHARALLAKLEGKA